MVKKRFHKHPELNNGETIQITKQCVGCQICLASLSYWKHPNRRTTGTKNISNM